MAVKTFSVGETLTASDTNTYLANSGLVYIGSKTLDSVTNNVTGVFSSTYDSYRIVISNLSNGSGTTRAIGIRFRTTSDDAGAVYFHSDYLAYGTNQSGVGSSVGQTIANVGYLANVTEAGNGLTMDVHNPNLPKATIYIGQNVMYQADVGHYVIRHIGGGAKTTTQYTGFSIIGQTDNLSGTVRVYGYRQA